MNRTDTLGEPVIQNLFYKKPARLQQIWCQCRGGCH